jgi:hypothetical protein
MRDTRVADNIQYDGASALPEQLPLWLGHKSAGDMPLFGPSIYLLP